VIDEGRKRGRRLVDEEEHGFSSPCQLIRMDAMREG
jgi:hypothetical protein